MILTSGCAHNVERINSLYDFAYLLPFVEDFCLLWSNLTKIYIRSSRTKHQTKRITLRQDTTENQQSCMLFRKTKSSNLLLSTDFLCGQARKWGNFSIHLDHKVQTFAFISKYSNYIECMFTCLFFNVFIRIYIHAFLIPTYFGWLILGFLTTFFSRNHHQPHRYLLLCNRTYHYHRDFCCIDYYEIRMHENIGYQLKKPLWIVFNNKFCSTKLYYARSLCE